MVSRHTAVLFGIVAMAMVLTAASAPEGGKVPITTTSSEARGNFLKARDLAEKLRGQESISLFNKAIEQDKNFAMAYYNLALVSPSAKEFFVNMNNSVALSAKTSKGEQLIIRGLEAGVNGKPEQQRSYYQQLVDEYPNDERAHFLLGGYYFGQQEYEKAIDEYVKSSKVAPSFSQTYNQLGYVYRFLNRFDKAEEAFMEYIRLIPDDPNPHDSYAELLLKAGRFDESIAEYRKALALDEHFLASRVGIAANLMYRNNHNGAMKELQAAYELSRNDGERRAVLATTTIVYADRGDLDKALGELDRQYAMGEKINDAAAMAGDLVTMGTILVEQGKYDEAIDRFTKATETITVSSLSDAVKANSRLFQHFTIGTAYARKGDVAKASKEAKLFRDGATANNNQNLVKLAHGLDGMIALREKRYDRAAVELSQAGTLNPSTLYRLAIAHNALGNREKAADYCRQAARFNSVPNINYAFIRTAAEKMLATL